MASMTVDGNMFLSLWPVSLQTLCPFLLSLTVVSLYTDPSACIAVSSSDSRQWLYKFCERHPILGQAYNALFGVILFLSLGTGKATQFPIVAPSNSPQSASSPSSVLIPLQPSALR